MVSNYGDLNNYAIIKSCCVNPKIGFVSCSDSMEIRMICSNCRLDMTCSLRDIANDTELIVKWNEMLFKIDGRKRDIVKADSTDYPYPFAMI